MGILNEKLKKELESIGVDSLPVHYKNIEFKHYQSQQTNLRLISYSIILQNDEVEPFVSSVKLRKKHPKALVQIEHVQVKKETIQYCKLLLFIQNIAINLEELMSLNFRDMMGILYFSIQGFSQLFKFYGKYFSIQSYMIGINDQGQAKVWFNRDYAKHQPKRCYSYSKVGNKQEAEQNMVKELKKLFFCKVQKTSIHPNFTLDALTFNALTIEIQVKFLNELFVNNFSNLLHFKETQQSKIKKQIYTKIQSSNQPTDSRILKTQNGKMPFIKFNYEKNDKSGSALQNTSIISGDVTTKANYNINFKYSNLRQTSLTPNTTIQNTQK